MSEPRRELTKKDKVNRFLYRCGVLLNDKVVEHPPNLDLVLERLQEDEVYDIVLAVVNSEQYGIDRKVNAIGHALDMANIDMPIILRQEKDKMSHDGTVNIWDYILRIARREDWKDYTLKGYENLPEDED